MLARTPFLSPDQLGLPAPQHRALVLTLAALERGDLRHYRDDDTDGIAMAPGTKFSGHFNMNWWNNRFVDHKCGTVACIGGTAELLGAVKFADELLFGPGANQQLHDLFYPGLSLRVYGTITPDQAARALRCYLHTGIPNWDEALAP